MKQRDYILNNEKEVLTFLKSKYPLYHLSNVFFRDIQYGIQVFLIRKKMEVGYADAEKIARAFVARLERNKILTAIDNQTWVVHYPEFKKLATAPAPAARPIAATKPAGAASVAPRPAGGALPPLKSGTPAAARPPLPPQSRPPAGTPKPAPAPAAPQQATSVEAPASVTQPQETSGSAALPPVPKPTAPSPAPAPGPAGSRKPLPPIKSSTPAGSKK
jgi:hypothetical protein